MNRNRESGSGIENDEHDPELTTPHGLSLSPLSWNPTFVGLYIREKHF